MESPNFYSEILLTPMGKCPVLASSLSVAAYQVLFNGCDKQRAMNAKQRVHEKHVPSVHLQAFSEGYVCHICFLAPSQ
jgi:hypothetical protein